MQLPISVVVFTKNEEGNIEDCINTLRSFSEIIVVDSQSTDNTEKLALSLNVSFVDFEWNGCYPKKKTMDLRKYSFSK